MQIATTGALENPRLPYKWIVALIVMFSAFMSILDQTIVNLQDAFWFILPVLLSAIVMVCLIPAQRRIPEQIPARDEGQDHSSAELMSIAS